MKGIDVIQVLSRMIDLGRQAFGGHAARLMAARETPPVAPAPGHNDNVVRLQPAMGIQGPPPRPARPALQEDQLFKDLCDADYFDLGERDGTRRPDHQGRTQGIERITARARLAFDHMVQIRIVWLDDAEQKLLSVGQQGSGLECDRVRAVANAWRRDIETLRQQRELAGEGLGWIEPLIVDYRAGYDCAMDESTGGLWNR